MPGERINMKRAAVSLLIGIVMATSPWAMYALQYAIHVDLDFGEVWAWGMTLWSLPGMIVAIMIAGASVNIHDTSVAVIITANLMLYTVARYYILTWRSRLISRRE